VICYLVCCHHLGKRTDKVSRKAAAGKREGMSPEQLLQMPAVRTDSFSITGFVTFTTQGTVIKQNLQTQVISTGAFLTIHNKKCTIYINHILYTAHYTHSTPYTVHYTLYTVPHTLYTMNYTQYSIYCTLYTTHCTPYTVHYELHTVPLILHTIHYTQFSCLLSTFFCFAPSQISVKT